MSKPRPFSKLKKQIDNLFDEKLKMEFCCFSYPVRSQYGSSSIPRYCLKIGKEYIWDFPKDFNLKEITFYMWIDDNNISNLVRDYIDIPLEQLLDKSFDLEKNTFTDHNYKTDKIISIDIDYKLTELFKAADRRLGKEKLMKWAKGLKNPKVDRILKLRFSNSIQ